jgi:hypothetical protein
MQLHGILLAACAVTLAGCGVQRSLAANDARQRYEQSSAAYRACLTQNPSDVRTCEAQRLVMETDEREFNTLNLTARNIEVRAR